MCKSVIKNQKFWSKWKKVKKYFDKISVSDLGLGGITVADGLAVPRTSGIVAEMMANYFSGGYTLIDDSFCALLTQLYEQEDIFLEPAAVAGLLDGASSRAYFIY